MAMCVCVCVCVCVHVCGVCVWYTCVSQQEVLGQESWAIKVMFLAKNLGQNLGKILCKIIKDLGQDYGGQDLVMILPKFMA